MIGREFADELSQGLDRIKHCLDQISDEQIWWRPLPAMNSTGNLMLHLAGNVRQWVVSSIGGVKDIRERQKEFDERGPIPKAEVSKRLETAVAEAKAAMARASTENSGLRGDRPRGGAAQRGAFPGPSAGDRQSDPFTTG